MYIYTMEMLIIFALYFGTNIQINIDSHNTPNGVKTKKHDIHDIGNQQEFQD